MRCMCLHIVEFAQTTMLLGTDCTSLELLLDQYFMTDGGRVRILNTISVQRRSHSLTCIEAFPIAALFH